MKVIYGNEPYLIEKYRKHYAGMITMAVNLSIICGKYDEEVHGKLYTYPLVDDKRVVILSCSTLKDLDNPLFYEYLDDPPVFSEFLIIVDDVDKRQKIYKRLCSGGMLVECIKISSQQKFTNAVLFELSKLGARISNDAYSEFCKRINYFEVERVNFIEVRNLLQLLAAISKDITVDVVKEYVPENREADVFVLGDLIKRRKLVELKDQLALISASDSILVLSLLLREFRIAYKATLYPLVEIGVKKVLFCKIAQEKLLSCISVINRVLMMIKTGQMSNENALLYTCGALVYQLEESI